jgi:hypothetical protein
VGLGRDRGPGRHPAAPARVIHPRAGRTAHQKSDALRAAGLPTHGMGSGCELNRAISAGLILVEHAHARRTHLFATERDRRRGTSYGNSCGLASLPAVWPNCVLRSAPWTPSGPRPGLDR